MIPRALMVALAIGCGAETPADDDGAPPPLDDAGTPDTGTMPSCSVEVAEPRAPALPMAVEWSCPSGWRSVGGACTPWPESGPADCPPGEAHFPGTAGCEPIGTDCPLGQFSEPPPEYSTWDRIYVDRSATPGGDGLTEETATSSFIGAIIQAYRAELPTVILVSKGEYPTDPFALGDDVMLWGACVRDTVVKTSTAWTQPVYFTGTEEPGAAIGNLTLQTHLPALAALDARAELYVRGVLIDGARGLGVGAFSKGRVRGERVVARNVDFLGIPASGFVAQGGRIELARAISSDNADYGIVVQIGLEGDPGEVVLSDVYLASNARGGMLVRGGGIIEADRAAISGNAGVGIWVEGGSLSARDIVVSDTRYRDDLAVGRGIEITNGYPDFEGGDAILERALLERNQRTAIYLIDRGATLELRDAIVRDTQALFVATGTTADYDDLDGGGYGLWVTDRTRATVERTRFERNRVTGIYVSDPLSFLSATDVVVSETQQGLTRSSGAGFVLRRVATASISRALFDRNRGGGIELFGRSTAMIEDVTVLDSSIDELGDGAPALLVLGADTRAYVNRGRFERNELYGVAVQQGSFAGINDVAIIETKPTSDGRNGVGLGVSSGARVFGSRVSIESSRSAGLVGHDHAGIELNDLIVRGTQAGISSNGFPAGRAMSLEKSVTATISRGLIEDNLEIGVLASDGSRLVMRDAAILRTEGLDGISGRGMQSQSGSLIDLERVCLEDNREVGILTSRADLVGRDVTVLGTKHNACFDDGTCEVPGGIGMYAAPGGRIAISGFLCSRNAETGITIADTLSGINIPGGEMDLIDGIVSFNVLGADVRDPSFDRSRITLRVLFVNNRFNGVESRTTRLPDTNTTGYY